MNRRHFLELLGLGSVALATLDVDRLLWRPGAKTFFLPTSKPEFWTPVQLVAGDIFTIEGVFAVNPITGLYTPHQQHFLMTDAVSFSTVNIDKIYPSCELPRTGKHRITRLTLPITPLGMWSNLHG